MKSEVAQKSFRLPTIEIQRNSGFMALKVLAEDAVAREGPLSSQGEGAWGRRDLNSHGFLHVILNHARLPIPTLPHHYGHYTINGRFWQVDVPWDFKAVRGRKIAPRISYVV
jgi:hypothetical protein